MPAQPWRLVIIGTLLWAVGCGDDPPTASDGDVAPSVLEGDGRALMPTAELPGGLRLRMVNRSVDAYPQTWIALYGDPDAEDPLATDLVHVLYSVGSETGAGWREGTTSETWVRKPTDDDDQEVDQIVLGARGLDETGARELLERVVMAEPLEPDGELRPAHLDPGDLNDDRQLLAEGPIDLSEAWWTFGGVLPAGPALQWVGPQHRTQLRISTISSDPGAALLLRSMIEDPGGSELRGVTGAVGEPTHIPPDHAADVLLASWEEDGLVVLVQGYGLSRDELEDVVAGLRVTTDEDWPALVDLAEQLPPPEREGTPLASGSFEGGRWWASLMPGSQSPQVELWIESVDGRFFNQGGVGACDGSSAGVVEGQLGSLFGGLAPPDASRVVLERAGGAPLDVATRGVPGSKAFWVVWVEGDVDLEAITAYSASGAVLERIDDEAASFFGAQGSGAAICVQPNP